MGTDLYTLKKIFIGHFNELKDFYFTFDNIAFWTFLLVFFLLLLRVWSTNKAFSFCLLIAIVLLGTTKMESLVVGTFNTTFEPGIIRIISLIIISIISIYYVFIKSDVGN